MGIPCGIILSVITPVTSFFITGSPIIGAIPAIMPCIMAGNAILVLGVGLVTKKCKGNGGLDVYKRQGTNGTTNGTNGTTNGTVNDTNGTLNDNGAMDNNGAADNNGNGNVVDDVVDGVGEAGKDVINGVENGVDDLTGNDNNNNGTTDNNGNGR